MESSRIIGGRYKLKDLIGHGGMGVVYRGIDTQTDQQIAIKQLQAGAVTKDTTILHRFEREAEALRQLHHPNIVHVLATHSDEDGNHYLIMEYVGGGDLRTLINREKQLSLLRTVNIALDIADALTRAHRLDITHRDLKPSNVLLDEENTPQLTDFGVAHIDRMERMTATGATVGTIDYLPPEALNGAETDVRTDIWAFGVTLFEMLTGDRPFSGDTLGETAMRILSHEPPELQKIRSDIPITLQDLIQRMLIKDPDERIPTIRLVGVQLEAILTQVKADTTTQFDLPVSADDHKGGHRFTATTPSATPVKHNLPAQTTSFIGREEEQRRLKTLLEQDHNRLITILASGGMGKTRLALEVARQFVAEFAHGVYFVPLSKVKTAEQVAFTIADQIGYQIKDENAPQDELIAHLQDRHQLLILDNFEHINDAADLLSTILRRAPRVYILATSRERLHLSGEVMFKLEGMDIPKDEQDEKSSAVQLFAHSARRVQPMFHLNNSDLPHVVKICRLARGVPLAIVLAASWLEMFSPAEIATEMKRNIDFLETELRDVPPRQRSLRAVFDYSWRLLNDNEKAAFRRLALFQGGFTRHAGQIISVASLRVLTNLVSKSLLERDSTTGRYEIHDLLRQFAREKLNAAGELEDTQKAHALYYAQLLAQETAALKGDNQSQALTVITADFENIRSAWQWHSDQKNIENLTQMLEPLYLYSHMRSREPLRVQMLTYALENLPQTPDTELLRSQLRLRQFIPFRARPALTAEDVQHHLGLAQGHEARAEVAFAHWQMAYLLLPRDWEKTLEHLMYSITYYRQLSDEFYIGRTLLELIYLYSIHGEIDEALTVFEEAEEITRRIGDEIGLSRTLNHGAAARLYAQGEFHTVLHQLDESTRIALKMDAHGSAVGNMGMKAFVYILMGNLEQAETLNERVDRLAKEYDMTEMSALVEGQMGILATLRGNPETGFRLCQKAVERLFGPERIPLMHWGIALAAYDLDDVHTAATHNHYALDYFVDHNLLTFMVNTAVVECAIQISIGQASIAAQLWGVLTDASLRGPGQWCHAWPSWQEIEGRLDEHLSAEEKEAAITAGRKAGLSSLITDLLARADEM